MLSEFYRDIRCVLIMSSPSCPSHCSQTLSTYVPLTNSWTWKIFIYVNYWVQQVVHEHGAPPGTQKLTKRLCHQEKCFFLPWYQSSHLPVAPCLGWGLLSPPSPMLECWLVSSSAGNHRGCEFMSVGATPYLEDGFLRHLSSGSSVLSMSSVMFPEPWLVSAVECCFSPICFRSWGKCGDFC